MSLSETGKVYRKAYTELLGNTTKRAKSFAILARITLVFAFVLGAALSAGHMSSAAGWIALGFGLTYVLFKVLGGNYKNRKLDLIFAAVVAALIFLFASLSCGHQLSSIYVGYIMMGGMGLLCLASFGTMLYSRRTCQELMIEEN